MQDGGVGFDTCDRFSLDLSALPKLSCGTDRTYKCLGRCFCLQKSPKEGYHGEPAITREQKHFSKTHESDCKPSTCLACSYLNWCEVSAVLCSAVNRMTTVTLQPRVKNTHGFRNLITSKKQIMYNTLETKVYTCTTAVSLPHSLFPTF